MTFLGGRAIEIIEEQDQFNLRKKAFKLFMGI